MKTSPATKAKTDGEIKSDVLSELTYEPAVKVTDIGVLVKEGVVTLNGTVTSHGEKWHAVIAAKRVSGVKAIADEIKVELPAPHRRSDAEIANSAVHRLEWSTTIPASSTRVTVRDGWITLEGEVAWQYQKNAAVDVMQHMIGVAGIVNQITVKPLISAGAVAEAIRAAFKRNAMLNAKRVEVVTLGSTVTLSGTVANNAEREEAERVAWAAPGVIRVDNQIGLDWGWGLFD